MRPTNRASRGLKKMASNTLIVTGLRSIQALVTLLTMIFMLVSFSDITVKEDGKNWRFAQLPHFFTVMAGILGFVYTILYCILVLALDHWSQDVFIERIADCVLAIVFAVCGFLVGSNGGCDAPSAMHLSCTNIRATIACLYISAVVFLASFVYSLFTQEIPHPDAVENLVPRGNYGPASPAVVYENSLNDNTFELKPRGNFGSYQPHKSSFGRDESGGLV